MNTNDGADIETSAGSDAVKEYVHRTSLEPARGNSAQLAIADAYFFEELCTNLGRKDAQRWLLQRTCDKISSPSCNTHSALLTVFPQLEECGLIRKPAQSSSRRERSRSLVMDFPQLAEFRLSPATQSPPVAAVQSSQASARRAHFRGRSFSMVLDFPQLEEFGFSPSTKASIAGSGRKPGYCAAHYPSEGVGSGVDRPDYGLLFTDAAYKVLNSPPCVPLMTSKSG